MAESCAAAATAGIAVAAAKRITSWKNSREAVLMAEKKQHLLEMAAVDEMDPKAVKALQAFTKHKLVQVRSAGGTLARCCRAYFAVFLRQDGGCC
jgi:nuclear transport factor 2 (NTF2) superfamily protein